MEAIITAATVLASYLNVATANQSGYVYNAAYEDNKVAKIEVYSQDGKALSRKIQNRFSYDKDGRLLSKETMVWNVETNEWAPYRMYTYTYDTDGYTISLSNWNRNAGKYADPDEKTVYHIVADNVMAVDNYRRTNNDAKFELTSGTLVLAPQNNIAML